MMPHRQLLHFVMARYSAERCLRAAAPIGRAAVQVFLAAFSFVSTGCGRDYRIDPLISDNIYATETYQDDRIDPIDLEHFYLPDTTPETDGSRTTAYVLAVGDRTARNRLQAILIQRSDRLFEIHKGHMIAASNNVNGGLDMVATVLAGIAPLFSVKSTVDALSVSAAMANQASVIFNDRAYAGLLLPKILAAMVNGREELRQALESHKDDATDIYTVDDMVALVNQYHQRGSILYGIYVLSGVEGDGVALAGPRGTLAVKDDGIASSRVLALVHGVEWLKDIPDQAIGLELQRAGSAQVVVRALTVIVPSTQTIDALVNEEAHLVDHLQQDIDNATHDLAIAQVDVDKATQNLQGQSTNKNPYDPALRKAQNDLSVARNRRTSQENIISGLGRELAAARGRLEAVKRAQTAASFLPPDAVAAQLKRILQAAYPDIDVATLVQHADVAVPESAPTEAPAQDQESPPPKKANEEKRG